MVLRGICILSVLLVSACAPQPRIEPVSTPAVTPALAAPFPEDGPLLINDYKRTVASRIVAANEEVFFEPLPEMLKSVVVLEITVRSEEHTSELQSRFDLVCRLPLE